MRGARRIGALFLCVTSVVAALEGDESAALKTAVNAMDGNVIVDVAEGKFSDEEKVSMVKKMLSSGFVATVDSDGNPIMVKKMPDGEFKAENIFDSLDMSEELEDVEFARQWLAMVTPLTSLGPGASTIGEKFCRETLRKLKRGCPPNDARVVTLTCALAQTLYDPAAQDREYMMSDVQEAETLLMEALQASRQAFGAGHEQTARVRQELDAVRAARRGDAVDGSKLERGPIVLDKPDDGDEKTIDSID